jgi:hypothetical protein
MAKVFIVIDPIDNAVIGATLEAAYKKYGDEYGMDEFHELSFFEAEQISVQQKLVKVDKLVLTKAKA